MNVDKTIRISAGSYEAWITPDGGARITRLIWRDREDTIECLVPIQSTGEFDSHNWPKAGAFVMLPFANRLSPASFNWNGTAVNLDNGSANGPGLHGFGHRQSWKVIHTDVSSVKLSFVYEDVAKEWPWPFRADISYSISKFGLAISVTIQNLSSHAMPAILGWHPFIPSQFKSVDLNDGIQVFARNRHHIGIDGLGHAQISDEEGELQPFHVPTSKPHTTAFENWSGSIDIPLNASHFLNLQSHDAQHFLFHVPKGLNYLCIEPVTALPGALQRYSVHNKNTFLSLNPSEHKQFSCSICIQKNSNS